MQLTGIHHLTAISARPRENLAFYTGQLGMRLVKKTVNQDDVSAYHLFYADGEARPGTDLTFFDFPAVGRNRWDQGLSAAEMRRAHWIKPVMVCQIKFTEWTRDDRLRQPVFLGIREDKNATEVMRERAS